MSVLPFICVAHLAKLLVARVSIGERREDVVFPGEDSVLARLQGSNVGRVRSRLGANFIKRASQRPKFCTEARDSVLKPAHTISSCRSSPEARSQRSPWFSRPATQVEASPESHILLVSDSARSNFKDLIIR